MLLIPSTAFAFLFLNLCSCVFVEINFHNKNESKSLRLVCGPAADTLNLERNHTVLWHGSQFGHDDHQKLSEVVQTDTLMPNIFINSSKRNLCYLLTSVDSSNNLASQKPRILRDSSASVPAEKGVCQPGHRIDQDRCFPCFPGSYTSGQDTECILCPKNFYMDKKAADSCWPCPEGKKTLAVGADSEENCIDLDASGHRAFTQNPPWVLIYCLIGIIIACVWIVIIILLIRFWRNKKDDTTDQVEKSERKADSCKRIPLLHRLFGKKDDYSPNNSSSEFSDIEDPPIYEEIDDIYEVPKKSPDSPIYDDLDAPQLPPKRRVKSSKLPERRRDLYEISTDKTSSSPYETPSRRKIESQYEVPIKKGTDETLYEVPIRKSKDDQLYEVPIRKSKDDQLYETPIKKSTDDTSSKVPRKKSTNDTAYEVPIRKSKDDHQFYETPIIKSMDDTSSKVPIKKSTNDTAYEVPIRKSKDDQLYETPIKKSTDDTSYKVPIKKSTSDTTYEVPISMEDRMQASKHHPRRYQSSERQRHSEDSMASNERMTNISEGSEDMYEVPSAGTWGNISGSQNDETSDQKEKTIDIRLFREVLNSDMTQNPEDTN